MLRIDVMFRIKRIYPIIVFLVFCLPLFSQLQIRSINISSGLHASVTIFDAIDGHTEIPGQNSYSVPSWTASVGIQFPSRRNMDYYLDLVYSNSIHHYNRTISLGIEDSGEKSGILSMKQNNNDIDLVLGVKFTSDTWKIFNIFIKPHVLVRKNFSNESLEELSGLTHKELEEYDVLNETKRGLMVGYGMNGGIGFFVSEYFGLRLELILNNTFWDQELSRIYDPVSPVGRLQAGVKIGAVYLLKGQIFE